MDVFSYVQIVPIKEMIRVKRWTREQVADDRSTLYVYGDNDIGRGTRGQAVIRGLPNAFGVPTKRLPALHEAAFYSDANFQEHCDAITKAVDRIITAMPHFERIALPEDGLGTGLAQLPQRAPRVSAFLEQQLARLAEL